MHSKQLRIYKKIENFVFIYKYENLLYNNYRKITVIMQYCKMLFPRKQFCTLIGAQQAVANFYLRGTIAWSIRNMGKEEFKGGQDVIGVYHLCKLS
jgi:hypothetical protein